ncbi:MAG TPA: ABC transporter permease [Hyphomicrobiaceae bacterium]|nr:ABC transporter permease [Hyphomicrobiaceae bacterium]
MSTVYIMWLRQMIRYFRSPPRIVAALAQPLLYMLAFGYGFGAIYRMAGQGSYLSFLAPGILGMSILFTSIFSGMELIWDRQFGFLKETLAAPVSRITVMLGRTAGGATVATFQAAIVLALAMLLGFRPQSWLMLPGTLVVMFVVALMFTTLGTWFAALLSDFQGFQMIMNFLVMPMFFLSGAMFPLDHVPRELQFIARCDPLSYGIDAFRTLLLGTSHFGLLLDAAVLVGVTTLFMLGASRAFSRIEA